MQLTGTGLEPNALISNTPQRPRDLGLGEQLLNHPPRSLPHTLRQSRKNILRIHPARLPDLPTTHRTLGHIRRQINLPHRHIRTISRHPSRSHRPDSRIHRFRSSTTLVLHPDTDLRDTITRLPIRHNQPVNPLPHNSELSTSNLHPRRRIDTLGKQRIPRRPLVLVLVPQKPHLLTGPPKAARF